MTKLLHRALCWTFTLGAFLCSVPVWAHEFWLLPDRFEAAPGESIALRLAVGEQWVGEPVPWSQPLMASLRLHTAGVALDLRGRVPAGRNVPELALTLPRTGSYLVALDTHPSQITLAPDKFEAYLREEGLEFIIERRKASGAASRPGRERYRRNVKTLLKAGDIATAAADATHATRTGQKLEIVPLDNPHGKAAGSDIAVQVLFDGQPLVGALVKAWHKRSAQTLTIRARSDAQGQASFSLPWAGPWMVSVVHMVPATGAPGIDWDSYWGNLTFELPGK